MHLVALAGLAIGFAAPILAEEQTTVDPQVRQEIEAVDMKLGEEKDFAVHFASSPPDISGKLVQVYAVGDEMAVISEWSAGPWKGYSLKVYVRDADEWTVR